MITQILKISVFLLAFPVLAHERKACDQLPALRDSFHVAQGKWTPPPGSLFRNVLIVEFTNGKRLYARTPMISGVRHQDMWDHATQLYGERPKILFAGEEVMAPEGKAIWVKDRSRLNDPKNRSAHNESHISHYQSATGFSHVIERPFSATEPHLHPVLNLWDSRLGSSQAKVIMNEVNVKHDVIDPLIIGTLQHLRSLFKEDDSDRTGIMQRLKTDLQRPDFAVLMESLRFDGIDTHGAENAIQAILKPSDFPNFIALKTLLDFLERFQPGVRFDTASRIEWTELPSTAPSDTHRR